MDEHGGNGNGKHTKMQWLGSLMSQSDNVKDFCPPRATIKYSIRLPLVNINNIRIVSSIHTFRGRRTTCAGYMACFKLTQTLQSLCTVQGSALRRVL
jgi:hypothetical protein